MISLKKKTAEWWDAFSKDKSYKRFIKTDFSKWCEEEDREYMGDFGPADDMGGMGGMGGMDFGAPPHASNRARQAITGGTSTAALCRGHGGTCLTLCFCTQVEWAWAAWVWMAWAAWATLATATTCRRSDEEVCPGRVAPAPPACRGELALMRGRWHLWLLATARYSCRTQEDEGDLGDLGPSDLPVRVRVRVS